MDDKRIPGVIIDLEQLEAQAKDLYLHRFVQALRQTRGAHGRFLVLRAGDQFAIRAAGDGSAEELETIIVEEIPE